MRRDGSGTPRFNDRPAREQTRQGRLDDCGVIATLGAVAAHRPGDIAHRIATQPDGTYRVRLVEARWSKHAAAPTRRGIALSVTPDLPHEDRNPRLPTLANAGG